MIARLMHCDGRSSLKSEHSIDLKLYVELCVKFRVFLYTIAIPPSQFGHGIEIDL